jgi:hypothetical protein
MKETDFQELVTVLEDEDCPHATVMTRTIVYV